MDEYDMQMTDSQPTNNTSSNSEEEDEGKKNWRKIQKEKPKKKTSITNNVFNISGCNQIQLGSNYNYTLDYSGGNRPANKKTTKTVPPEVKRLYSSLKQVEIEHINRIKRKIGKGWKDVGRELGYTDGQLEQLEHDNRQQIEVVYNMLLVWIQANGAMATLGNLCFILCQAREIDAASALYKTK